MDNYMLYEGDAGIHIVPITFYEREGFRIAEKYDRIIKLREL